MRKQQQNQLLWIFFFAILIIVIGLFIVAYKTSMDCPCAKESMINISENEFTFGTEPSSKIPNIIWAFWDGDPPETVKKCVQSWKHYNPEYEVILLNKQSLSKYLPDVDFGSIRHAKDSNTRFSDFVRLNILAKYGGIYIDASTICHKPFSWLHAIQKKKNVDFIGYYIDKFTEPTYKSNSPVIENWFFASTPNSAFVQDWLKEFMRTNEYLSIDKYLENVQENNVSIQKIDAPNYLAMHVAAQSILQKNPQKYDIYLFPAEKGPFKYLVDTKWNVETAIKLLTNESTNTQYFELPIVKMRGCERPHMDVDPKRDNAFSHLYYAT